MPGDVVGTLRGYKALLWLDEKQQIADMTGHWKLVERALGGDISKLADSIAGKDLVRTEVIRLAEYKELRSKATRAIAGYERYVAALVDDKRSTLADLGAIHSKKILESAGIRVSGLTASQIEDIATQVPLKTLMSATTDDALTNMTRNMLRSFEAKKDAGLIASDMTRGLRSGLQTSLNIARSEEMRAYREVSRQQYADSGRVDSYKRMSAQDATVCLACLIMDGVEYDIDQEFIEHVCGRCIPVPVINGQPEPKWETGKEWLANQSEDTLKSMLGPGRLAELKPGPGLWASRQTQKNLEAMVQVKSDPVWGKTLQMRRLKQ